MGLCTSKGKEIREKGASGMQLNIAEKERKKVEESGLRYSDVRGASTILDLGMFGPSSSATPSYSHSSPNVTVTSSSMSPAHVTNRKFEFQGPCELSPIAINNSSEPMTPSTSRVCVQWTSEDHKETNPSSSDQIQLTFSLQSILKDAVPVCDDCPTPSELVVVRLISKGSSSQVYEVMEKESHTKYALKILQFEENKKNHKRLFTNELNALTKLNGVPGVIGVRSFHVTEQFGCFLAEFGCQSLFNWIKQEHTNREFKVKLIIRQLLKTLMEMHEQNIVHRDIKPENVVFVQGKRVEQKSDEDDRTTNGKVYSEIKFIDFGEAAFVNDETLYHHLVGTPCYLAPERFRKHYGWELKASDVWSIGVLAFEACTGKRCFHAPSPEELRQKITSGDWHVPQDQLLSPLCQHFISVLLTTSPTKRPSAKFALNHPWLVTNNQLFQQRLHEWNHLNDALPKWATYTPYV